jgi:hypothetical protein
MWYTTHVAKSRCGKLSTVKSRHGYSIGYCSHARGEMSQFFVALVALGSFHISAYVAIKYFHSFFSFCFFSIPRLFYHFVVLGFHYKLGAIVME